MVTILKKVRLYVYLLSVFLFWCFLVSCKSENKEAGDSPIDQVTTSRYTPDWESLKKHKTPEWFRDAKFGIYCHWGPYSVPAFENEWYSHWMYTNPDNPEYEQGKKYYEHHIKTYGPLDEFGYKDFIPMFTAKKFDAAEWAGLFQSAGAKFAGPVSEHADGFAMWDSDLTQWDAKDMGPRRDIMGELEKEIRKRDMKFVATFHRQWLFAWYPTWDETTDASDPKYSTLYGPKVKKGDFQYPPFPDEIDAGVEKYYPVADKEFNKEWLARLKEIVDKYDPDLVWFDNKMDVIGEQYRKEFLAYYYNEAAKKDQQVVVTYKFYDLAEGTAVLDVERARMSDMKDFPWLTDDSVDWKAWSHIDKPDYKSADRIIDFLVDVVSKNGCLLLNITPKANGEIPEPVSERLLKIGEWLRINGEAIYGTRPWKIFGEGPAKVVEGHLSERENPDNTAEDIRFTQKGDKLFAILLAWPEEGKITIESLGKGSAYGRDLKVKAIRLLGSDVQLQFEHLDDGLSVTNLGERSGAYAHVLEISL